RRPVGPGSGGVRRPSPSTFALSTVVVLITQVFWGLIRMMIFAAFYANAASALPMSLAETIAYIWLGQAFFAMFPLRGDAEIGAMIRSGKVAYELLQPALSLLPFRGLMDPPFRLFTGNLAATELPLVLTHQLVWTAAFILFGRWLLSRWTHRLVVQGG
ncbi:MAG: hypothetical protein GW867_26120, partial [Armatimonadetes bacterium]|nr:hypothetical protein [Armatimonadota bacterium]